MISGPGSPQLYGVSAHDREPLIRFMVESLQADGCRILYSSSPHEAPFRIAFETPGGERMGIVAYAFLATFTVTKNRPTDEHTFQIKYGTKDGELHDLWQDPTGIYTTLVLGINPQLGIFVGIDPVLHSPTKFFIRVEFKQEHVSAILQSGWHSWERKRRRDTGDRVEVLVGGTRDAFLHYVRFERDAVGLDQGHRQLLAQKSAPRPTRTSALPMAMPAASAAELHRLAAELELSETEVLDLIANTRRLKMAVRGWAAEEHLVRALRTVPGVSECARSDAEGGPDVTLRYNTSRPITIECKNVLRETTSQGLARIDFMRTRAAQGNPCSRYYSAADFDVVAACLHAVSEEWEFRYAPSSLLDPHQRCPGKLSNRVHIDQRWNPTAAEVLAVIANR